MRLVNSVCSGGDCFVSVESAMNPMDHIEEENNILRGRMNMYKKLWESACEGSVFSQMAREIAHLQNIKAVLEGKNKALSEEVKKLSACAGNDVVIGVMQRNSLRAQVKELTEALECLLPYIEPYSRDITGLYTKRPEVAKAEAVLKKVKP